MSVDEAGHIDIEWTRVPVPREVMNKVNRRSDVKGLAQALGHLGLLASTGSAAFYSSSHWHWSVTVLITFVHGTFYAFLLNGFHELCHGTVFRTKALNALLLRIFSFLGQHNYVHFQESHTRHHRYTLHPPSDLEVVLPMKIRLKQILLTHFFYPPGIVHRARWLCSISRGKLEGEWNERILPRTGPSRRAECIRWQRILLVGHALIVGVSCALGLWMIPVLVTFAPAYGIWLRFLCNETQHIGLQDDVTDFRLCCRSIYLNPFVRFLYWHMNYHIEHHMYAAVPCYNLGKLHRAIEPHLPPTPDGIVATWKQIIDILKKQAEDPSYQYVAPLPDAQPVG